MTLFYFILIFLVLYSLVITFILARRGKRKATVKRELAVVDTSVLIDGRIENVAKTGFISGTLLIPKFVLDELQSVSDSTNALKRNRGRRGMKILKSLQKLPHFKVKIVEDTYPEIEEVDEKIIRLAKEKGANILTVDYNLNQVADIQEVFTLNINELANALKPAVLPGEEIAVKVVQRGKERDQGVGYLDDGTMVVVEDGIRFMGRVAKGIVSRIFQTDAGRMIFVKLKGRRIDPREERRRRGPYGQRRRRFIPRFPHFGFRKKRDQRRGQNYNQNRNNFRPRDRNR